MGLRLASCLFGVLASLLQGCSTPTSKCETPGGADASSRAALGQAKPRLVVWITVDQMRGDYLERYRRHFQGGGFRWLLDRGRFFTEVRYGHAITETAPGHATLFTGTAPRQHGIIANDWLLSDGTEVSSVSDEDTMLIGAGADGAKGKSPRRLLAATIGDALKEQTQGAAHVVSVSVKDRGAILPGGRSGLAFWLASGGFVTSSYYADQSPVWFEEHQRAHPISSYLLEGWKLSKPEASYENEATTSPLGPEEWGPRFPHRLAEGAGVGVALSNSPFGDVAVLDLALSSVSGEGLGQDDVVDLLAISLSSTDKIGHQYGPESRELEDQLIRLNSALQDFFTRLSEKVPQSDWIVVLSADHGGCESAEYLRQQGRNGIRLTEGQLETAVRKFFSESSYPESFLLGVSSPYVFLNRLEIEESGADLRGIRKELAETLERMDGIYFVHALGEAYPRGRLGELLSAATYPERSGDLYIVPEPDTLFLQTESLRATHGSPWDYDTHVPVVLVGRGVSAGRVDAPADVRSLMPTVARMIGIQPPSGATWPPLDVSSEARR